MVGLLVRVSQRLPSSAVLPDINVYLSFRSCDEICFINEFLMYQRQYKGKFGLTLNVTGGDEQVKRASDMYPQLSVQPGRMAIKSVGNPDSSPDRLPPQYLLCGPSAFAENVSESLRAQQVPRKQIHFERWW